MLVELTHRPPTTPPALRVAGGVAYNQLGVFIVSRPGRQRRQVGIDAV